MNQTNKQAVPDSGLEMATQIERLVDGELVGDEYRHTVQSLDQSPDGWRRCALAFLESQAFRQALPRGFNDRTMSSPVKPQTTSVPIEAAPVESVTVELPTAGSSENGRAMGRWGLVLATAASFLVAFGLGVAVQPWVNSGPAIPLAKHQPEFSSQSSDEIADKQSSPTETLATSQGENLPPRSVRLVVDNGAGGRHEIELPVQDWDGQLRQSSSDGDWGLPPQIVDVLRQTGHDVHRRQQLVPVALDDGSQLVIPVEQMRIVPVGQRAYQ